MNYQNVYDNGKDCDSVKYKGKKSKWSKKREKKRKTSTEESELTYHFQGQYVRSQHWFNLDPDWIKDNFFTMEPKFFKSPHLKHITGQTNKYWFTFSFPMGTAKKQVNFNSSQTALLWYIRNMNKTFVVLVV